MPSPLSLESLCHYIYRDRDRQAPRRLGVGAWLRRLWQGMLGPPRAPDGGWGAACQAGAAADQPAGSLLIAPPILAALHCRCTRLCGTERSQWRSRSWRCAAWAGWARVWAREGRAQRRPAAAHCCASLTCSPALAAPHPAVPLTPRYRTVPQAVGEQRYQSAEDFKREISILRACRDPNVVSFLVRLAPSWGQQRARGAAT